MKKRLKDMSLLYDTGMSSRPTGIEELKEGLYDLTVIGDDGNKCMLYGFTVKDNELDRLNKIVRDFNPKEILFSRADSGIVGSKRRIN